ARAVARPEDRRAPARLRPGACRARVHARGDGAGGDARTRAGGRRRGRAGRDQDAQPVRRQRRLFREGHRRRPRPDERLRVLARLGPPAGADGHARGDRADRGAHAARRRARAVHRLRGRRHVDGGRRGGRRPLGARAREERAARGHRRGAKEERETAGAPPKADDRTRDSKRETGMSLDEWIEEHARNTPERVALRFPGRDLNYAQLAQLVRQLAAALAREGIGRGGCVGWLGHNSPEMLALLFAAARLGAMFMPLNWRLAAPEHRQMLADCPPGALFVEPAFVAQTDAYRATLAGTRLVALADAPSGWTNWKDFLANADPAALPPRADLRDEPLLICYTSGSTGKPKGVLLTQRALAANAENSAAMHEMTADDRILTTLPLFHVGGLNNQTTPALRVGATVVLHPRFDVEPTFDALERERITLTVLVPAQLDAMMAHPRWATADLSSLRMITTGSTIVPEKLIRTVHARGVPMVQVYGATETCPIAAYQRREDAERVGSAGRAARGCELRIVDD